MLNINFVPDDYVQSNESRRANLMCLALLMLVMLGLGGSFMTIKMRQRACATQERMTNARMTQIQESIKQFEDLQTKRQTMMKTALTTAELLEPVPRSVLLASLTNNLPPGVSLLKLKFMQKEPKRAPAPAPTSKYKAAQAGQADEDDGPLSQEQSLETHIDIGGMAPSDIQVAAYIEQLSRSSLLNNVALVESKEFKVDETTFRQFKLTAMLKKNVHLSKHDVEGIRARAEGRTVSF